MVLSLLPLYKIWGGASFFASQTRWETRDINYEIHSIINVIISLKKIIYQINSKNAS